MSRICWSSTSLPPAWIPWRGGSSWKRCSTWSARRTVLFSTHITSDLERVADRVAVLKDGKIVYSGELDALKDSVKRLHVQAAAPLPNGSFRVPGMLHAKVTGNEAVVSVQDFTADLPERIAQQWSASVAVQDLNLEDIFLELHHG